MDQGEVILDPAESNALVAGEAILALVFARQERPDADAIARLTTQQMDPVSYSISHRPPGQTGWLELLVRGMTFDCHGLAPGPASDLPEGGTLLGLTRFPEGEAIALVPGPHLVQGQGMMPVVRNLAGLGAVLADLPKLVAIRWLPAQCWMTPDYFRRLVRDWLNGGAFPALGLTALDRQIDGAMVTRGLELLVGQELRFEPGPDMIPMQAARIAVRLIHHLIEHGPMEQPEQLTGPEGEILIAQPLRDKTRLLVTLGR